MHKQAITHTHTNLVVWWHHLAFLHRSSHTFNLCYFTLFTFTYFLPWPLTRPTQWYQGCFTLLQTSEPICVSEGTWKGFFVSSLSETPISWIVKDHRFLGSAHKTTEFHQNPINKIKMQVWIYDQDGQWMYGWRVYHINTAAQYAWMNNNSFFSSSLTISVGLSGSLAPLMVNLKNKIISAWCRTQATIQKFALFHKKCIWTPAMKQYLALYHVA